MFTINLPDALSDDQADALGGTLLGEDSYDRLLTEDADVYRPDGELLLKFRKAVLPVKQCRHAYLALREAARKTENRGMASGSSGAGEVYDERTVVEAERFRIRQIKRDGTLSRTRRAKPVESGIVGYFDRTMRAPYCRLTAFNLEKPDAFRAALPFIRSVDAVFAAECPERYAAQRAVIGRTHPDFYIHGTVFTTVTVNRNWQTAVHQDAGDLPEGFGVMSAIRAGLFDGGHLVFPQFRVAVELRTGDVLLADVHPWHGNTPLVGAPGGFERISFVFYYRSHMERCGSAAEELERAKRRQAGDPLYV